METSRKASLGCGTMVLIAMIVAVFGTIGSREAAEQVRELRNEAGKIREEVRRQGKRMEALERRLGGRSAAASHPAAGGRGVYFNRPDPTPPPPAGWRKGVIDPASNRVAAFWVLRKGGSEAATVQADRGMMVIWEEGMRRFYLFDNAGAAYFVTEDFERYLAEVERLPEGIALDWVDTCTASLCWQMPEESRKRLLSALARGNRRTDAGGHDSDVVCTCESAGVKLLGGEAEGDTPAQTK